MKVPHGAELSTLAPLWPVFLSYVPSYVLSFVYIGIYWNNHDHMFQLTESVSGGVIHHSDVDPIRDPGVFRFEATVH